MATKSATPRIGWLQQEILYQMAHQRVPKEKAGMDLDRVAAACGMPRRSAERSLEGLIAKKLVSKRGSVYRILEAGRKIA